MGGVGDMEAGIRKLTWKISTITYAHDTTLLGDSKDDMSEQW